MRLSCVCIRVGQHTARPEMKAPGSEDDVRLKHPYGEKYNKVSFRFFFFRKFKFFAYCFSTKKKEIRCNASFLQISLPSSHDKGFCFKDKKACF